MVEGNEGQEAGEAAGVPPQPEEQETGQGELAQPEGGLSIGRLKNLINVVLVLSVVVFTGAVSWMVNGIFDRFGPAVLADLEWKASRGVQELARSTELGIIVRDEKVVKAEFADYEASRDVQGLVAVADDGTQVALYGEIPDRDKVFEGEPETLRYTDTYISAYANTVIEGVPVGRVAIVVSMRRLKESEMMLDRILIATLIAGAVALLGGLFFVSYFTRAVADRDKKLANYAATLEQKVAERTAELHRRGQEMRLVLDNVEQGFVTLDLDGVMSSEKSAVVSTWFGNADPGQRFVNYIEPSAAEFADAFDFGFEPIKDDLLPLELYLYQLPGEMRVENRTLRTTYTSIMEEEQLRCLMVVMTDVTAQIEAEAAEREQKQSMAMFERIMRDRQGFEEFVTDCGRIVEEVASGSVTDPVVYKRLIHTVKGNTAIVGITSVASVCHAIEDRIAESEGVLSDADRALLGECWSVFATRAQELLGESARPVVELSEAEYAQMLAALEGGADRTEIRSSLEAWLREPVIKRLESVAEQARGIARRLDKGGLEVSTECAGLRLESSGWSSFWSNLVHVLRNAIDHGIEDRETRVACGKSAEGRLALRAYEENDELVFSVSDDGAGIDWERVRGKASESGLPCETQEELERALFSDGLSTRDEVSATSGRGVGMSAVLAETESRNGFIEIQSCARQGTTFQFRFPRTGVANRGQGVHRQAV